MFLNNPEFVKIGNKKYKINTDFRVAIECNDIAMNNKIGEYEKALAVIYKLFGDEGLYDFSNRDKLLELGQRYLRLDEDFEDSSEEPDMDFIQDRNLIASSFKYDYKYNPYELEYLHWWDFYTDMCNLSNSEFGNCCVLNRVRNLRNFDVSKINDSKEKEKALKSQKMVALKRNRKVNGLTEEQKKSAEKFIKSMKGE